MQTLGQYRVGIDFNPSASDTVGRIKSMAAQLIDFIDGLPEPHSPVDFSLDDLAAGLDLIESTHLKEVRRLKALAQTAVEDAAMWAVKAATKPQPKE